MLKNEINLMIIDNILYNNNDIASPVRCARCHDIIEIELKNNKIDIFIKNDRVYCSKNHMIKNEIFIKGF